MKTQIPIINKIPIKRRSCECIECGKINKKNEIY